jgi:hypothetical protein
MTLGSDGCTDNEDLKNWFLFILKNQNIKDELVECSTKEEFVDRIFELAKKNNYLFTRPELEETFDPFGEIPLSSEEEDKWIQKLLEMGWSPLGYSR